MSSPPTKLDPIGFAPHPAQDMPDAHEALFAHLRQCQFTRSPMHRLHATAQLVVAFASPRTISLMLLVVLGCAAVLSLMFGAP